MALARILFQAENPARFRDTGDFVAPPGCPGANVDSYENATTEQSAWPEVLTAELGVREMPLEYRGVEFAVKAMDEAPSKWRWIVYRRQPQGRMALGELTGSRDDAIIACKREIDKGLAILAKRNCNLSVPSPLPTLSPKETDRTQITTSAG